MPTVDFDKYQSRAEAFPDDDEDAEPGEGDVLILDPQLPKKHEPNFDFSKYAGRQEDFNYSDDEGAEIIINPRDDLTRKKLPGIVPFGKLTGRPVPDADLEEPEPVVLNKQPPAVLNDPSKKKVRGIAMTKTDRFEKKEPSNEDELLLPAEFKPIDREKVLFKMDKARDRFKSKSPERLDGEVDMPAYPKEAVLSREKVLIDMNK